jgi:hypothetical protein
MFSTIVVQAVVCIVCRAVFDSVTNCTAFVGDKNFSVIKMQGTAIQKYVYTI